ncbi:Uncharacterized protein TCAP_07585 [Tolypocladium capitatum]|uniref:Uncharacterized protein n=1 Tax=Tolypocladium capitatum TaxID=45235 RepID=A0A2K3PSP2_9HYPO|nr:Uncharacterized protein TCAP_07585 [Tolypocladium capitatum]
MDFVKKAADGTKSNSSGEGSEQKQDYVDKAFGVASKKSGHNLDRNTQEKITDAGRGAYEKVTGQVDPKISN